MRYLPVLQLILVLALVLGASGPSSAQQADAGSGFEGIRAQAEAKNPVAMVAYALLLLEGGELPYDPVKAGQFAQEAADLGDSEAQLLLSIMLEEGLGLQTDPGQAKALLNQAADTGLPEALYQRAIRSVDDNPEAAMEDLVLAGAQGHVPALQVLATLRHWDEMDAELARRETTAPAADAAMNAAGDPTDINVVIAIQAMLGRLGYDAGLPNGQQTPQLITAIVLYQVDKKLPPDGQSSVALRDHIASTLRQEE